MATCALEPSSLRRSSTRRRRTASRPVGARRAPASLARLLHDALRDQAVEPQGREPAPAGREVERDRRRARRRGRTRSTSSREAWKLLLFNQFHDTLAGTSIEPAYEDARDQIGHASSLAASAFNAAMQSIARQIAIEHEEEMRPVVVFNPHAWPLRTDVEVEYTWPRETGASRRRRRGRAPCRCS